MQKRNTKLDKAIQLALAVGTGAAALAVANPVLAEEGANIEEVTVTGSRIPRKDFISNAPVATVGSLEIELTNTVNTESLLNTLPQAVPGLDRTSNNPGDGTASIDLRGLGANRTLVLIDGARVVPTSAAGVVDINTIPNALIERVEVVTGGASAVYGSDAVAGVVNFIMKDDFEGADFRISHELTEEGDAGITSVSLTLGANLDDGRGNVVVNLSHTDRDDLFQGDRDFSETALFDNADASGLEPGGSSGIPGTSIFSGTLDDFSPDSLGVTFDPAGEIRPFVSGGDVNDFYNYAPVNYIQLPQERYQASALGSYEINECAEVYGSAMYTYSNVPQQLAATPIFQTVDVTIDGNPFLSPQAQQVLSDAFGNFADADPLVDSDGDGVLDNDRDVLTDDPDLNGIGATGSAFVRRRLLEVGERVSDDTFNAWQLKTGLKGEFNENLRYDAYIQTGRVTNSSVQLGNVNRDRFQQALLLDLSDPTGGTCADPSENGSTVPCSPINIFGEGNISEAGAAFLRTAVAATAEYETLNIGATLAGNTPFELAGGPIGWAIGLEHRDQEFDFIPSQDLAAGTIAGFNGSPPTSGGYDVDAFYAEALIPILDNLELELAFRSEDYSTIGSVSSYKVAGSFAPTDVFRIRGGFNTAVRAPNIGELFAPAAEGFPGATDPCSSNGAAATDPAVAAICTATGVPGNVVGTPAIALPAGQVRALGGGNPNLIEEEADTFTVGVVVTPFDSLTFSIDYFDIEIEDAVAAFGGGASNILTTCYDPASAFGGAGSDFCNVVNRRSDGTIDFVETFAQNVAEVTLKGIDLAASYQTEVFGGDLDVRYLGTWTDESDFIAFTGADTITCAGEFGSVCGEPTPEYKHRVTANWSAGAWTGQLIWRLVGEVDDDDDSELFTVESIDSEHYFDLAGSFAINDNYKIGFGIDNVADTRPPILGANDEQANTYPATYDVFGRTFYLSAQARF